MSELPSFRDRALLQQALTHKSYTNEEASGGDNNERLEFLGDAILTFLIGDLLYKRFPNQAEGELTPLRASLVDKQQLAEIAIMLKLGPQLLMGKGVEGSDGRRNPRLLCSAFEALIGAYYLDCGSDIEAVRQYVAPLFEPAIQQRSQTAVRINYKSRFQAWALETIGQIPQYRIINETGPDHAKCFVAEVLVSRKIYGTGQGPKKQDAEKNAAKDALEKLGLI
ncbi:MAG: ribonuclease III [Cyanobacteria bacterium P01_A01_bin.123]